MRTLFLAIIVSITNINAIAQTAFYRSASISMVNQKMVFESNRDGSLPELYLANIDGTSLRRLTNNSAIEGAPQWSPDGKSIAYYALEDRSSGNFDIHILDIETMYSRKITTHTGLDMAPVWSPDGQKIYYTSRRDGTDELRVFDFKKETDELFMKNIEHHYGISFSPDGSKFLAVKVYEKNWDVVMIDTETKSIIKRFDHAAKENNPIWSSDGQTIFFASNRDSVWQIYSMGVNGNNVKNLTEGFGNSRFFTVSPSGKNVFFTLIRPNEDDSMYRMNSDGTDKVKINF